MPATHSHPTQLRGRIATTALLAGALVLLLQVGASAAEGMPFFLDEINELQILQHDDAPVVHNNDQFGYAVAVDGDRAIIGAHGNDGPSDSGSAYIFERDGGGNWSQIKKLTASDGADGDQFGISVGISGGIAVVGAFADGGSDTGSAYVFKRNGGSWDEVQKLNVNGLSANAFFGFRVAIDGDTIAVSAFNDTVGGEAGAGAVWVFQRDPGGADVWSEVAILQDPTPKKNGQFGTGLAVSGDTIAVGVLGRGKAMIFDREPGTDNWNFVTKFAGSDAGTNEQFARHLDLDGDTLVAGAIVAPKVAGGSKITGAAYIFERDKGGTDLWGEVARINPSDGAKNDQFGIRVAIHGATIVVGAFADDPVATDSGSAYVFTKDAGVWTEAQKLVPSNGGADHWFGWWVDVSEGQAFVGAPFNNLIPTTVAGWAYVFDIAGAGGVGEPPPDLPAQPTDFDAVGGEGVIDMTWVDNAVDEIEYKVKRQEPDGSWLAIAVLAPNTTDYTATGVPDDGPYCYRVHAVNLEGSSISNEDCTPTLPDAPTNVAAVAAGPTQIDISWTDKSGNEDSFKIKKQRTDGTWKKVGTVDANVTSFTHTGRNEGQEYCYKVQAHSAAGNSPAGPKVCATTPVSISSAPTALSLQVLGNDSIKLTWTDNANGEDQFQIREQPEGGSWSSIWVPADTETYTATGLDSGTEYCYKVKASFDGGLSQPSNTECATTSGTVASTTQPPAGFEADVASVVMDYDGGIVGAKGATSSAALRAADDRVVVRVYKDINAWWNENRDEASLAGLGKVLGYDAFVHPTSDLWLGIPADTDVVYLASAAGDAGRAQIEYQNSPVAQIGLQAFVAGGGTLIAGLADNLPGAGYQVPGAEGSPRYALPSSCQSLILAPAALGVDGVAGTADDHPLLRGPDRVAGTDDDVTGDNVGLESGCYVAHGSLTDGMVMPAGARVLLAADFGGEAAPVMAEYGLGEGRVIVTTITLEYEGQYPAGTGPARVLTNLLDYAFAPEGGEDEAGTTAGEAHESMRPVDDPGSSDGTEGDGARRRNGRR